mgnify:CR=1 FL=1
MGIRVYQRPDRGSGPANNLAVKNKGFWIAAVAMLPRNDDGTGLLSCARKDE